MKSTITFLIYFLVSTTTFCQTLTPEQKNTIFELSKQTSNVLSDLILVEFVTDKRIKDTININLQPATNINNKVTDFGNSFCGFLESTLQSKLNSAIIKKYNYKVSYKTSSGSSNADFNLNISYFMKDNALAISRINLIDNSYNKISLKPFEVSGNMANIKDLNSVSDNMFFDKIVNFNADNQLFNSLYIYDSNKNEQKSDNSIYYLNNNENYKFRISLVPRTYLYVFLYESEKSSFYIIYPNTKQNNKQVTYKIKDIKNILFSNLNTAVVKIVVSNRILNINESINDKNNTVSPKQAENIYEELIKYEGDLSTRNFNVEFE